MGLRANELLIILLIVLVLFGGSQLPKLARSLGQAQREFKKSAEDDAVEHESESGQERQSDAT